MTGTIRTVAALLGALTTGARELAASGIRGREIVARSN